MKNEIVEVQLFTWKYCHDSLLRDKNISLKNTTLSINSIFLMFDYILCMNVHMHSGNNLDTHI